MFGIQREKRLLAQISATGSSGKIEKKHIEAAFEWKINDIFSFFDEKNLCRTSLINSPVFFLADLPWNLRLSYTSLMDDRAVCVCLNCEESSRIMCSVKYNIGLRKEDGSIEQLATGVMKEDGRQMSHIKNLKIKERIHELAPLNVLTITCSLKLVSTHGDQLSLCDEPKRKKLRKLDTLSENFESLFINKVNCDTTLHVRDKDYKAHRAVLIARSSVFAAMFQHETSEKQTGIINILDCDPDSFEMFLEFLYSGTLDDISLEDSLALYGTSAKYDVQELKIFCGEYLLKNLNVKNFCEVVVTADMYNDTKLLAASHEFFNKNLSKILQTSEWDCFVKENYGLSKKLLIEMSSNMKFVS